MNIPQPTETYNLKRLIPIVSEVLTYCAVEALESGDVGSLHYDGANEELTYHLKVRAFDETLFDYLYGVDEIWIICGPGRDS